MIGTLPPWKGISSYCKALYDGLNRSLRNFTFAGWRSLYPASLYPGGDPRTGEEPVKAENVQRRLAWYDPVSWLRLGLDPDIDLIHAQWWSYPLAVPYVVVFAVGKARGKTILLTVHNVEPHEQTRLKMFLNAAVYRFADEHVVHSDRNRKQLTDGRPISPEDVHVIPHPTIGPDRRGVTATEALSWLNLDEDADVVLFFGNVREYKGLDSLVEMVAALQENRDIELVVAGKSWVNWSNYEALIAEQDLTEHVHRFPGYIPEADLEYFFTAADVVALPYDYFDAQSGVAELADHFETPTVGYDVGGLADQVDVVADDRAEFKQALCDGMDSNLSKSADSEDAIERHLRLYEDLLDENVTVSEEPVPRGH
ncbi:glycosyltransferase [Natronoarchaeum sp. GCM10025703]